MTSPTQDLKITLVQTNLHWENPQANYQQIEVSLESQELNTDLIVLPEMFPTGFSMNSKKLAEGAERASYNWMKRLAAKYDAAVVGSIITRDNFQEQNNTCFNRLHWVFPDGELKTYDKRHLFSFADEDKHFSAGQDRLVVRYKGWRICPLICYDLRFPVWSRNKDFLGGQGPVFDLLIYVANWPKARARAWSTLLEARAHENQVYTCGVNRVGLDANDIEYDGNSVVFSPKGESLCQFQAGEEAVKTISLNFEMLQKFRDKFPVAKDGDAFKLID